jgi:hypothetical protein
LCQHRTVATTPGPKRIARPLFLLVAGIFLVSFVVASKVGRVAGGRDPDYLWKPPAWVASGSAAIATTGMILLALCGSFVYRIRHKAKLTALFDVAIGLASVGAAIGGVSLGVMVRPVVGANIGGGLGLLVGLPISALGIASGSVLAVKTVTTRSP